MSKVGVFFLLVVFFSQSIYAVDEECLAGLRELGPGEGWVYTDDLPAGVDFFGYYKCSHCDRETPMQPDPHTNTVTCKGCGHPHSTESYGLKKAENGRTIVHSEDIADTKAEIRAARAGLKWRCHHCGNSNHSFNGTCEGCGASKESGSTERIASHAPTRLESNPGMPVVRPMREITEPLTEYFNPPERREVHNTEADRRAEQEANRRKIATWAAGLTGAATLLGGGIYWATRTQELEGEVESMEWDHEVQVERFTRVTKRDWREDFSTSDPVMPVNGRGERAGKFNVRNCRDEYHHTDQVPDGIETYQETVTYTYYENETYTETVDNGNGSFSRVDKTRQVPKTGTRQETRTRTRYRDVPRYKEKCDYDTYVWTKVRSEHKSGGFPEAGAQSLPWPEPKLGKLDRAVPLPPRYKVDFAYERKGKNETYPLVPKTTEEFLSWERGESGVLTRRNLGGIIGVEHSD